MRKDRQKGLYLALALAAVAAAGALLLRNFWVLGYFPSSGRIAPSPAATASRGGGDCSGCHDDIGDLHDRGPHSSIFCQDCHGPVAGHAEGGEHVGEMPKSGNIARLCSLCHREMNARSESAPKLDLESHVVETGALFSDRICLDCHMPHDPRP